MVVRFSWSIKEVKKYHVVLNEAASCKRLRKTTDWHSVIV
jgi:hypothetical protein